MYMIVCLTTFHETITVITDKKADIIANDIGEEYKAIENESLHFNSLVG